MYRKIKPQGYLISSTVSFRFKLEIKNLYCYKIQEKV